MGLFSHICYLMNVTCDCCTLATIFYLQTFVSMSILVMLFRVLCNMFELFFHFASLQLNSLFSILFRCPFIKFVYVPLYLFLSRVGYLF